MVDGCSRSSYPFSFHETAERRWTPNDWFLQDRRRFCIGGAVVDSRSFRATRKRTARTTPGPVARIRSFVRGSSSAAREHCPPSQNAFLLPRTYGLWQRRAPQADQPELPSLRSNHHLFGCCFFFFFFFSDCDIGEMLFAASSKKVSEGPTKLLGGRGSALSVICSSPEKIGSGETFNLIIKIDLTLHAEIGGYWRLERVLIRPSVEVLEAHVSVCSRSAVFHD
jgi:hypothetical protein